MQLEELLDWQIGPALRTVPGIIEVNSFGGEDKQYQVMLDPRRLQAAGVSIAQVVAALEKSNANAGGGYIEHNREHFVIGTNGLVKNLDDLRNVVIGATPQGVPITIATVGDVQFGPRLRRGAASKDGKGEVVIGVAHDAARRELSRTVTEAVKSKLALLPSLPRGDPHRALLRPLGAGESHDPHGGQEPARGRAPRHRRAALAARRPPRGARRRTVTIPLALLFAVTVMNAAGLSGNLMSLGAIDFGLMVDGAVIIVENAVRRLSERRRAGPRSPPRSVPRSSRRRPLEVRSASVFGEAIIAIVYLPLLALTGIEGKLFRPWRRRCSSRSPGAFVLSLTVVPVLTSLLVKPEGRGARDLAAAEDPFRSTCRSSVER
jgi:cobalt-zinc-cadmium resistance protein CzcA